MKTKNFTSANIKSATLVVLVSIFAMFAQSTFAKEVRKIGAGKIEIIYYDAKDQGKIPYNYKLENWPSEAKDAIDEALRILDNTIELNNKMTVSFIWSADLVKNNTLGEAYTNFVDINGVGGLNGLDPRYKYPGEFINQLLGTDQFNGSNITIAFNSTKDWCYSFTEEPFQDQQDLITVALHELTHGLGLSSSLNKSSEKMPFIYDKFIVNGDGDYVVNTESYTKSKSSPDLTSNDLYYAGTNMLNVANEPVKLHAPNKLSSASICHFDRIYGTDENARLMMPGTAYGISTRYFGAYSLAILEDIGWTMKNATRSSTVANEEINLNVNVYAANGVINIDNSGYENLKVSIYTSAGQLVKNDNITGSQSYDVNSNTIYVVKINNQVFKVRA